MQISQARDLCKSLLQLVRAIRYTNNVIGLSPLALARLQYRRALNVQQFPNYLGPLVVHRNVALLLLECHLQGRKFEVHLRI